VFRAQSYFGFAYARMKMDAESFGGANGRPRDVPETPQTVRYVAVPHWSLALLAGVLPFAWFRRVPGNHRRAARRVRGFCAGCGYDLRGSRERCPECGGVPDIAPQHAA
jgi:hypothetical protein